MTQEQERAKLQLQREAQQKALRLRQSALMLAEDKHGSSEDLLKLKHALDDAQLAEKKFNDELQALRLDTQLAKTKYDKALEQFIDAEYRLSESDWEKVMARFTRG